MVVEFLVEKNISEENAVRFMKSFKPKWDKFRSKERFESSYDSFLSKPIQDDNNADENTDPAGSVRTKIYP